MTPVSPGRRIEIAASILDADLGRLSEEIARADEAGADRIHLDVMDAHFVPNLTFGAKVIKAVRGATTLPFDAHLMTDEPGRFVHDYLDAGCDSVTFHVEISEPIQPTLDAIHAAGRLAGLSVKPKTPLTALEPYRGSLDILLVMTVKPGFGGQAFLPEPAQKIAWGRDYLRPGGRIHVDGGIRTSNAGIVGRLGVDVLVAGTALFRAPDMAAEIRALRDEASAAATTSGTSPGATYAAIHPRTSGGAR